jgi:CRP/FNR family transcriptional regulator, cyclic AMP receptor protein
MPTIDKYDALRKSKLAVELTDEQCRVLSERMTLRDLKTGEILIREGHADNHLYAVVSGTFGVVKHAGSSDAVTLHTMAAGDFIDELGFIDGTEPYASKVAIGDACVLGLEREQLEALLSTHAEIVYKVMRAIIRTVHMIQRRLSMQSVELANYIYKQHGRY